MIVDVQNNEIFNKMVNDIFIRGMKLIISFMNSLHNHILKSQKMLG